MPDLSPLQWLLVELALLVFAWLASRWDGWQRGLSAWLRPLQRLSQRPGRCFAVLFAAGLVVRLCLLPWTHVPVPLYHDEFSYLLGADTFRHWRLTNPTPPVPIALETIHTDMWPTYQSMYMPGPALLLFAGQLMGSPWIAVLLATALFPALLYWAIAGWLPRTYALLGGVIATVMAQDLNWWFDNYFCLALSCIGTTLVLGSLPRISLLERSGKQGLRWAAVLGLGLLILMLTRPYEGFCVAAPCLAVLLWKLRALRWGGLLRLAAVPLAIVGAGFGWLLFYNWRGTGHPLLFPYMLNFRQYHLTGPFLFSARHALPHYDNGMLARFFPFAELPQYDFMRLHPGAFLAKKIAVYYSAFLFGMGSLLAVGCVYLLRRWSEGLLLAPLLGLAGFALNVALMAWAPFPQYAAPAAPLLYLLVVYGVYALHSMPAQRWDGVRFVHGLLLGEVLFAVSIFGYRVSERMDYLEPQYVSKDRALVTQEVLQHPGRQLCLVRYTQFHDGWQEWVFNGADPKDARLVWARSLNPATDRAVIAAYAGRTVWLVRPDDARRLLQPYSAAIPFSVAELDPVPTAR